MGSPRLSASNLPVDPVADRSWRESVPTLNVAQLSMSFLRLS